MREEGAVFRLQEWTTIAVPEFDTLPADVVMRAQNLAPREIFPTHTHGWNQLVYATSGTLVVTVADAWYVITPEQAIWVPTGVPHTTGALHGAAFRNLYVADLPGLDMPATCTVLSVSPLMRALIIELEAAGTRVEDADYIGTLNALIRAQLRRLRVQDFHLPWPRSPQLHHLCETLLSEPADDRSADAWARELGWSGRTLLRRFESEVGLSLRAWRHRLRVFLAVEWLCAGRNVTDIALDLGYASTSAFSYMFRLEMGCTPSAWRRR